MGWRRNKRWLGDFTYADNGRNTDGERGYLYLTRAMQTAIKSSTPYLRFTGSDHGTLYTEYGALDIYAIYAIMLALDNELEQDIDFKTINIDFKTINKIIQILRDKSSVPEDIEQLTNKVRGYAVDYFYYSLRIISQREIALPKLGNQPAKSITTKRAFAGKVPLFLTRKKMPSYLGDDVVTIASNLGVVSGYGSYLTTKSWLCYKPKVW